MKKIALLLATVFTVLSYQSSAQFVGSGGTSTVNARPEKADQGPWKNRFTIYGGLAMPMGAWNKDVDGSSTLSQIFTNNAGMGARRGFYFEMGSMFYLHRLRLLEQMGVAINVTYLHFVFNSMDWSPAVSPSAVDVSPYLNMGTKLGATYSYKILDKLYADAYFNLCPSLVVLPEVYQLSYTSDNLRYDYDVTRDGIAFSIRKNIGFNVRYDIFTFGLDFLLGGVKETYNLTIYDNQKNTTIQDAYFETRFRPSTMQIKLGFTL